MDDQLIYNKLLVGSISTEHGSSNRQAAATAAPRLPGGTVKLMSNPTGILFQMLQ